MNVFISWSGEKSKAVGELLDNWLQCVIQRVQPWMSSKDIDRGSLWFSEITDQLKDTTIGIICLTHENKNKPWILFEAGALAKGLSSSRVCTFLIDLDSADISDPLAQFNHTSPTKDGMWSLIRTLNSLSEKRLPEKILDDVFETYWPKFEIEFKRILKTSPVSEEPSMKRNSDEILTELLTVTRGLDRRLRDIETTGKFESNKQIRKPFFAVKKPASIRDAMEGIYELLEHDSDLNQILDIYEGILPKDLIVDVVNGYKNKCDSTDKAI